MRSTHLTLWPVNHVSYELLNNNILLTTVAIRLTNAYLRFTVDGVVFHDLCIPMNFTANVIYWWILLGFVYNDVVRDVATNVKSKLNLRKGIQDSSTHIFYGDWFDLKFLLWK